MSRSKIDYEAMVGKKYGRWSVIKHLGKGECLCRCDCGTERIVSGRRMLYGRSLSCGCLQRELAACRFTKHGKSETRLYGVYDRMKSRCYRSEDVQFHNYGGRGIRVCDEWLSDFGAFYDWAMKSGYDPDAPVFECTIERIDVNDDYCPENCTWANMSAQNRNKRPYRAYGLAHPVVQLDLDGRLIKRFPSMRDAREETGCLEESICRVCTGKYKTSRGFKWMYAEDYDALLTCGEAE